MSPKKRQLKSESRIFIFRILTVLSLICTGVFCATFGYILLSQSENSFYSHQYSSLANGLFRSLTEGVESRISAGQSFAAAFGGFCPESSNWPNCWIPYFVFQGITSSLGTTLQMILTGILPIVRPHEVASFENFTKEMYVADEFPPTTGYTSGEYGIYSYNYTSETVYHDTTGENPWNPYGVLIPALEFFKPYSVLLLYNALSSPSQALALNELMTCSSLQLTCNASVTDILTLRINGRDSPTTIMFVPITPIQNQSDLVGFVSIFISWPDILEAGTPSVLSDIYVVLSSGVTDMTFLFSSGRAVFRGKGDLHNKDFNHKRKTFPFFLAGEGINKFNYSITLYPAQEFYDTYHTKTPFYVCLVSLLIVLGTSLIFLIYDFFVKRESLEQTRILEAKQTYVRFISHEIRTPLNIVCLGMQAMRSDLGTITETVKNNLGLTSQEKNDLVEKLVEADALVEDVTESSSAAVLVLNDLINYDKIENKTLVIEAKQVSPVTLVTSTIRTLQVQAKQANVKLLLLSNFKDETSELYELVRRDMCIIGDSMKLSQVIRNVVSNALKFSATGDTVSVKVRINSDGFNGIDTQQLSSSIPEEFKYLLNYSRSGSLVIDIIDQGPGMAHDEMSRLFQEGVQFNPNQLQAGQGSGLGLWISKGIIELHLGKLSAYSEGLGKGSTFTIEIPLVEPPQQLSNDDDHLQADLERGNVEEVIDTIPISNHPPLASTPMNVPEFLLKKILIVDDTTTNRKIVRRILKSDGYTDVDEAKDGLECVEMVSSRPPNEPWYDLILMDYEMPRMNGPVATSRLRELGYTMPIIGVTGNILSSDVDHFVQSGANSVLPKPIVMKDLYISYSNALIQRNDGSDRSEHR